MVDQPFTILKLLLIAILVIQPVSLTYAMTDMAHHGQGKMSAHQSHDNTMIYFIHEENTAASPDMAQDMAQDMAKDMDSDNSTDNCCNTPACSAAVMSTYFIPQCAIAPDNKVSFHLLWKSTALLSEKKPPRNLFV